MRPGARLYGYKAFASGGDKKVSQPRLANAISTPKAFGRKVDLKMR